jgi:hypothetical protein
VVERQIVGVPFHFCGPASTRAEALFERAGAAYRKLPPSSRCELIALRLDTEAIFSRVQPTRPQLVRVTGPTGQLLFVGLAFSNRVLNNDLQREN